MILRTTTPETPSTSFRLMHVAGTGTLTLERLTLKGGYLYTSGGGGIANRGTLTITSSTLRDNSAYRSNGGIGNSGTLTITNSTLSGNNAVTAAGGGGIGNSSTLTLTNSTLSDNWSFNSFVDRGSAGGGIDNSGTLTITSSTLSGNWAYSSVSGLELQNTILARNTLEGPGGPESDCSGPVTSLGTNLIGDPAGCTITLQESDLTGDPGSLNLSGFVAGRSGQSM